MKPEKRQLMDELLDDASRREITLLAGAQILRRRRHWRVARRGLALALVVTAAGLWLEQKNPGQSSAQIAMPATKSSAPAQAQSLTDDELLALFPDTPVALAKLPNGKKLLIFPRPGDEKKFITRL